MTSTLTSTIIPNHQRSSIDMSLELEHSLDADAPPSSPTLDPDVLSSLVIQMRTTLAEVTQSRDDLLTSLSHAHSQEAELRDSLALAIEKSTALESEVETLRNKTKEDEDTISLLRQKVEESRRGLMRLQTEQRRQSTLHLDLSKTQTSRAAKRASLNPSQFTPLTGSGMAAPLSPRAMSHRRSSSVSEQIVVVSDEPTRSDLHQEPEHLSVGENRTVSRLSGMFRSTSPPQTESIGSAELESLKRELDALKSELTDAKGELRESNEAREASDTCVKALREFISMHAVGEAGQMTIPALPAFAQEPQPKKQNTGSTWGGLFWRAESGALSSTSSSSSSSTPLVLPIKAPSVTSQESSKSAPAAVPFSMKLGGLFSRTSSSPSSLLQPHSHQQEPMLNGSDTSSVAEPEEPTSPVQEPSRSSHDAHLLSKSLPGIPRLVEGDALPTHQTVEDQTEVVP